MRQLQTAEGLAAFAAGIAHDVNNALSVILGGLALVEQKLKGQLTEVVKDMRESAALSAQLAAQLMQLGRTSDKPPPGPVQLSTLVYRTVGLMRRRFPEGVVIDAAVPEGLVTSGLEVDLHLVLMNLILNARDAMPDGGTVTVTARNVSLDATQATAKQLPSAGSYVELAVKDTGSGMDAETKARAFEPFFTTKAPGHGAGLGLALVHGIVSRHGGAVAIDSAAGKGSTFTVWLPAPA
jgi:signal transduction histidine kinase